MGGMAHILGWLVLSLAAPLGLCAETQTLLAVDFGPDDVPARSPQDGSAVTRSGDTSLTHACLQPLQPCSC